MAIDRESRSQTQPNSPLYAAANLLFTQAMTVRITLATSAVLFLALSSPLEALQIHHYDPERHLRFGEGTFPEAPLPNEYLWVKQHNFHGVGWSATTTRRGLALISPRHFVGANHFRPNVGSQVEFLGMDGQLRSYTYSKFYNIKNSANEETDIFIGELSADIPASHGIPLYPVLDRSELQLTGREILVYGRGEPGPRIGRGVIDTFNNSFGNAVLGSTLNDTRNYTFRYSRALASQDDSYGENGDSGSPSFIVEGGLLTLSGIHSAILQVTPSNTTTYDSFILHYKDQINDHMAATNHRLLLAPLGDTGFEISTVERTENQILLHVHNPAQLPYDVHRTTDLTHQTWETVATSQTNTPWTGAVPPEADRVFWRLVRYPLPTAQEK